MRKKTPLQQCRSVIAKIEAEIAKACVDDSEEQMARSVHMSDLHARLYAKRAQMYRLMADESEPGSKAWSSAATASRHEAKLAVEWQQRKSSASQRASDDDSRKALEILRARREEAAELRGLH